MDFETPRHCPLSDGRVLSYYEFGDPAGMPIFYFHGFPGSGYEGKFFDDSARRQGNRIISPDRPGLEESTFQPGREFCDWGKDVRELADYLGLDQYLILGISGGAPYAYACAASHPPERLRGVITISGVSPITKENMKGMDGFFKLGVFISRRMPWLLPFGVWLTMASRYNTIPKAMRAAPKEIRSFSPEDQAALAYPGASEIFGRLMYGAFKQGVAGCVHEVKLYTRTWGLDLGKIPLEIPIEIWHGEKDTLLPLQMAHDLHSKIPHSILRLFHESGHISTAPNHANLLVQRFMSFIAN